MHAATKRNKGKNVFFFVSSLRSRSGAEIAKLCFVCVILALIFFPFLLYLPHRAQRAEWASNFHSTIFRFTEWKMCDLTISIGNGNWHAAFPLLMDVRWHFYFKSLPHPHPHQTHCNRFGFGRSMLRSRIYRAMDERIRMCICPPKIACFAWKNFIFCTHVLCICCMCETILMCGVSMASSRWCSYVWVRVCVFAWLRVLFVAVVDLQSTQSSTTHAHIRFNSNTEIATTTKGTAAAEATNEYVVYAWITSIFCFISSSR